MSQNLNFCSEIMDSLSPGLKRRGTVWLIISAQIKSQHLWWYRDASMHTTSWETCTFVRAALMLNDNQYAALEAHTAKYMNSFSGRTLLISARWFQTILRLFYNSRLHSKRAPVQNWPALSPIENIWSIMKRVIHQWWPWMAEQLKTLIMQEWENFSKYQRCLLSF